MPPESLGHDDRRRPISTDLSATAIREFERDGWLAASLENDQQFSTPQTSCAEGEAGWPDGWFDGDAGYIAGAITAARAAAAIGSATGAYGAGQNVLFAVDNGTGSALYLFTAADANAAVSAAELTLLANLTTTASTTTGDFIFGP